MNISVDKKGITKTIEEYIKNVNKICDLYDKYKKEKLKIGNIDELENINKKDNISIKQKVKENIDNKTIKEDERPKIKKNYKQKDKKIIRIFNNTDNKINGD